MKLSSLVGLTVISLDSGRAIGEIKKLLLDADPKKVEFIVLDLFDDKREGFAVHLFRYADLQGMGDVAVTIGSLEQVRTISSEALYHQVFEDQISIFARSAKYVIIGNATDSTLFGGAPVSTCRTKARKRAEGSVGLLKKRKNN